MRRARVQVKPNVGGRQSKPTEIKKEEIKTESLQQKDSIPSSNQGTTEEQSKKDDSEKEAVNSSICDPVIDQSKENQVSSKAASSTGRRSRIKPQVKIMAKTRGTVPASQSAETDKEASSITVESSSVASKESCSKADQKMTLMDSDVGDLSAQVVSDDKGPSDTPSKDKTAETSVESPTKEVANAAGITSAVSQRRSRFSKPKPNIVDSGRKRARLSSLSGASDTDEETHQSLLKRAPPPVQRIVALASPPHNATLDGVQLAESGGGSTVVETSRSNSTSVSTLVVAGTAMEVDHEVSVSAAATTTSLQVTGDTMKTESTARSRAEARKKVKPKKEKREVKRTAPLADPVDKVKMRISDLIYYNPTTNRMKSSLEEEERKKQTKGNKDGESVVGSPRRSSVVGSPDRQSVISVGADNRSIARSRTSSVTADPDSTDEKEEEPLLVPQLKVGPDGQIIVNEESLVVKNPNLDETLVEEESGVIEEYGNAPYKPSQYYGKLCKTKAWSFRETKKFYLALSVIGSDFSMMSSLFPGRDRLDLKKKFKKEEKQNRWLVDKALKDTKTYDLSIFDTLTSSDDEETKKMKDKQEKERKKIEAKERKRLEKEKLQQQKKEEKNRLRQTKKKRKRGRKKLTSQYYDASSSEGSDVEGSGSKAPVPLAVTPVSGVSMTDAPPVEFHCDLCDKKFKSKSALRAHIYRHTKNLKVEIKDKVKTREKENGAIRPPPSPLMSPVNLTPGGQQQQQLLFVTSTTPADKDGAPGQSVVHMYMLSPPPPATTSHQGGVTPKGGQPALCPATTAVVTSSIPGHQQAAISVAGAAAGVTPLLSPVQPPSQNPRPQFEKTGSGEMLVVLASEEDDNLANNEGGMTSNESQSQVVLRNEQDGSLWSCDHVVDVEEGVEEVAAKEADTDDVMYMDLTGAQQVATTNQVVQVDTTTGNRCTIPPQHQQQHLQAQPDMVTDENQVVFVQVVNQADNDHVVGDGNACSSKFAEESKLTGISCSSLDDDAVHVYTAAADLNGECSTVKRSSQYSSIHVKDAVAAQTRVSSVKNKNKVPSSEGLLPPRVILAKPSQLTEKCVTGNSEETTVLLPSALNQLEESGGSGVPEKVQTIRIKIFNSPGTDQESRSKDSQDSQGDGSETSEIRLFLG